MRERRSCEAGGTQWRVVLTAVSTLLADRTRLQTMGLAAHTLAKPDAARVMAEAVVALSLGTAESKTTTPQRVRVISYGDLSALEATIVGTS
jgi:hypothetical protein